MESGANQISINIPNYNGPLEVLLDLAKSQNIIDQTQYDEIWEDNVMRWLFGEDQKKKEMTKLFRK